MERVTTVEGLRARLDHQRQAGRRIGLVATMGALHDGHLELVRHAAGLVDVVVVSIFVNPTQFAAGEDLDAYPTDIEADEAALASLAELAPRIVFAPSTAEMYPLRPPVTEVHVGSLTDHLCGASRPTHFIGVATVVAKLFAISWPDVAVFGRKDFQQLAVVRRMAAELHLPVEVVGAPTVREPDGVAMSSRNRYLDGDGRLAARALSQGLAKAVELARAMRARGVPPEPGMLAETVRVTLDGQPGVHRDYVSVVDPDTLQPLDPTPSGHGGQDTSVTPDGNAIRMLVAVAAHVGAARLIDNVELGNRDDEDRLLAATGRT